MRSLPRKTKTVPVEMAVEAKAAVSVTLKIQTRLLLHWAQIAIRQEREAHAARAELERRREEALRTGAGLDLTLELHPSMLTAAAAASAIDALYGEVKADAGLPEALRKQWRENDTPRYSQIFETLKRGFRVKEEWHEDLKWLFQSQRDAVLHPETGFDDPEPHPLGVNTAREYVIYRSEHAERAVDLMLEVLEACAKHPRPALEGWAAEAKKLVADLTLLRGAG